MNTNTEFRNNPGQEGIAIHSHRALLGRLAADGCKPRHGRCDRKRERSYSGLRVYQNQLFLEPRTGKNRGTNVCLLFVVGV